MYSMKSEFLSSSFRPFVALPLVTAQYLREIEFDSFLVPAKNGILDRRALIEISEGRQSLDARYEIN